MINSVALKWATTFLLAAVLLVGLIYMISGSQKFDQSTIINTEVTYTGPSAAGENTLNEAPSSAEILQSIPDFVTVPDGGLDWRDLATTKSIQYAFWGDEGQRQQGVKPDFSREIKALDGKVVKIQGYMFPLAAEEEQATFLLGPFPISCPYHYHVGPALVIEASAVEKIDFSWDALTLTGVLELVPQDDRYNIFYRLHDARLVE